MVITFKPNKFPWVLVDQNYHYLQENEHLGGENFPLVWARQA